MVARHEQAEITKVSCLVGLRVLVSLSDGSSRSVDMAPLLYNNRSFTKLRDDKQLFETLRVAQDGRVLEWANGSRVLTSSVLRLPNASMTKSEFRAIMDELRLSVEGLSRLMGVSTRVIADYRAGTLIPGPVALAMRYISAIGQW